MNSRLPALIVTPHNSGHAPFDVLFQMLGADAYVSTTRAKRLESMFFEGDPYTDLIFHLPAAQTLHATVSRFVVDLNRDRTELGDNGVIKLTDFERRPLYQSGFSLSDADRETRLERYWDAFHRELEHCLQREPVKLLISGHAMMPRGPQIGPDAGAQRPALTLMAGLHPDGRLAAPHSSLAPTAAQAMLELLEQHFGALIDLQSPAPRVIALGDPWATDQLSQRYSDPTRANPVAAFGLEINQALYLRDGVVLEERVIALNRAFAEFVSDAVQLVG